MPDTFLDFFEKLQQRQAAASNPNGPPQQRTIPESSLAARAAATAGPSSRPYVQSRNLENDALTFPAQNSGKSIFLPRYCLSHLLPLWHC